MQNKLALWLGLCAGGIFLSASPFATAEQEATKNPQAAKKAADRSGKTRTGKASYYGPGFAGKKMADGTPMNPQKNIAASKTLPLGSKAKVTNLDNGQSTEVEIRDRGPYVDGRIIDLSPKAAEKIDMKKDGVAPVAVTPTELPPQAGKPDASAKDDAGSGALSAGE